MKRNIEWKEKTEDGQRRFVRVSFPGQGKIKWQFKFSTDENWDYDTDASPDDWAELLDRVEKLYQRNRCAVRDRDLVRKMKEKYG